MSMNEKLKQARLEAGLSQRQLCGDVITRNMLSQIENGSARPSMDTLKYLASRLGKPVSYFLEEQAEVPANLAVMEKARALHSQGNHGACLKELENYASPDPVLDGEYLLLKNLTLLRMARKALAEDKLPYSIRLLEQVDSSGLYYPVVQREHQLLMMQTEQAAPAPDLDEELLVLAEAAWKAGDFSRCADLLQAVSDKETPRWCYLRGEVFFGAAEYKEAARCYHKAEQVYDKAVYARLETCYRELGDFKLAYEYACRQR